MSIGRFGACAAVLLLGGAMSASDEERLFSSYSPIHLTLTAPLDELFENAQEDPAYAVQGALSYQNDGTDRAIDGVDVSVRGRTSKRETECSFPKLKLRFKSSEAVASSIFAGMKALKIGTHCGDQPDGRLTERFGRLANEKAPLREAFVYRLLDVLRVPTFRARPARITYVFGDAQRIERNAMLLEDDREAMKRFGASREIEPERFRSADRDLTAEDTAKLAFAEALVGNFDWCLRFFDGDTYRCDARRPLWNIMAFASGEGRALPVLYDFDIAGIVVGRHSWFPTIFYKGFESKSAPAIEVISQVQHTRSLFSRAVLDATRRGFIGRKNDAFRALDEAVVDPEGRTTIKSYMNSFFDAIERDDQFYAPVVVREHERIFLDASKTRPACGQDSVAPVGTLVGRPLATNGEMVKVALLDVQWHWTGSKQCDAVHEGPVWIEGAAIGTDYPAK